MGDVRLAQQRQSRFDEAHNALDVAAVGGLPIGAAAEKRAEQFIGSIEEVKLH